MDRRSFLRVALLGGAGAATVAACPAFLEDLVTRKSYFFINENPAVLVLIEKKLAEVAAKMGELLATDLHIREAQAAGLRKNGSEEPRVDYWMTGLPSTTRGRYPLLVPRPPPKYILDIGSITAVQL